MRHYILQIVFLFVIVSCFIGCAPREKKLKYEITSTAPIRLDINYMNAHESKNEVRNYYGTQWTYEMEVPGSEYDQSFSLGFVAFGATGYTTTARIYSGDEIVAEQITDCSDKRGGTEYVQSLALYHRIPAN